jgi:hypothetical protein
MAHDKTALPSLDLSDVGAIEAVLIRLQRRLARDTGQDGAPLRQAVREALLVTSRTRHSGLPGFGLPAKRS